MLVKILNMNDKNPNHVEIEQLYVGTNTKAGKNIILDGINLAIPRGKTLALVGESGSGKSLTALSIAQLLPTNLIYGTGSQIQLGSLSILDLPEIVMQKIRGKRIGFVFQEPMTALNPVLTIEEQLREAMTWHKIAKNTASSRRNYKKQIDQALISLLDSVGIQEPKHCLQCYPHQLSGGMKQRVMIAIALAAEPDLLIADEPTTAVDVSIQAQILDLLKRIQREKKLSMLFITHDLGVVKQIADQIAVMYHGQIVEYAEVDAFFAAPKHPYSQQLFAAIPSYEKRNNLLPVTASNNGQSQQGCKFTARCPWVMPICNETEPPLFLRGEDHQVRCYLTEIKPIPVQIINAGNSFSQQQENIALLSVQEACVYFPIKKGLLKRTVAVVKAVENVSFDLYKGETLAVVGESGSGKTTLAKAMVGLLPFTSGNMTVSGSSENIQMVFQDPYSSLNPKMLVADIIAEGLRAKGQRIKDASTFPAILTVLDQVGLSQNVVNRYPHEFSGGQRQRIAIARALILSPTILICDEPTSALDLSVQAQVLNLLKTLQYELKLSYLFITHNLSAVSYIADRAIVMKNGKIVEEGAIETILFSPQHDYTKMLIEKNIYPSHFEV
jgi:peptide/nickel transport system ATP-binding protein